MIREQSQVANQHNVFSIAPSKRTENRKSIIKNREHENYSTELLTAQGKLEVINCNKSVTRRPETYTISAGCQLNRFTKGASRKSPMKLGEVGYHKTFSLTVYSIGKKLFLMILWTLLFS